MQEVVVLQGSRASREVLFQHDWELPRRSRAGGSRRYKFNVLLTSYEMLRKSRQLLVRLRVYAVMQCGACMHQGLS